MSTKKAPGLTRHLFIFVCFIFALAINDFFASCRKQYHLKNTSCGNSAKFFTASFWTTKMQPVHLMRNHTEQNEYNGARDIFIYEYMSRTEFHRPIIYPSLRNCHWSTHWMAYLIFGEINLHLFDQNSHGGLGTILPWLTPLWEVQRKRKWEKFISKVRLKT